MIIHGIILLIVAVLELWLGLYILNRSPKDPINRSFIFLTASILIWVLSNALIAFISNSNIVEWLYRLTYVGGAFIGPFFVLFAMHFPYRMFDANKKTLSIIVIPPIAMSLVLLFTNLIVSGLIARGALHYAKLESLFTLYIVYFLGYFIWAFVLLYKKFVRSDGIHRWQLKYILLSTAIPFIVSMITDIFMPWVSNTPTAISIFFGSESSIVWLALTAYVAFGKYKIVKVNS